MDFYGRSQKSLSLKKIDKPIKKDTKGYVLEVDVEHPKELHENHNKLPFLAERMEIGREEM